MGYVLKKEYSSVGELETKDRAVSVMYGRRPDSLGGGLVPLTVDASGNLVIGSTLALSTDDIDIGDVVIKGQTDPTVDGAVVTPGEERIGLHRVGDVTAVDSALHAVLSWDPRMSFTGPSLQVTTIGSGTIFAEVTTPIVVGTHATWADTGTAFDVTGFQKKSFVLKNTGVNACDVRAFISVDGGVSYDIPILGASNLNPGGVIWIDEARAFTHFKWQVQRSIGDTTAVTKGFAE